MRCENCNPFRIIAWTGGTAPRPIGTVGRDERHAISYLFREQVTTWAGFWGDFPDRPTLRVFWNRARYDAHASFRHAGRHA